MRYLSVIFCIFLGGCGVRQMEFRDGTSQTEIFVGPSKTISCASGPGMTVKSATLGLWTNMGATAGGIGFNSGRYFCGATECQVVIWPNTKLDVAELRRELGAFNNICVVK